MGQKSSKIDCVKHDIITELPRQRGMEQVSKKGEVEEKAEDTNGLLQS